MTTNEIVSYDYGANAGKGWENTAAGDFSIPFLNQLQNNSPQCDEGSERKLEGARAGMFFNSVTGDLFPADVGVTFVPCLTTHKVVEWVPRTAGGGFVAEHEVDAKLVNEARVRAKGDPKGMKSEEGNDLVETYTIYALRVVDGEPGDVMVIPFTKTKIKRYRAIMTRLRSLKGASKIPLFANQVTMKGTKEKNPSGQSYFNVELVPAVNNDVTASLLNPASSVMEVARLLHESVASGRGKANYESAEPAKDEVF